MGETNYSYGLDLAADKADYTALSVISTSDCSWDINESANTKANPNWGINESAITKANITWRVIGPWETTTSNISMSNCINSDSVDTKPNVFRAKSKFRRITIK